MRHIDDSKKFTCLVTGHKVSYSGCRFVRPPHCSHYLACGIKPIREAIKVIKATELLKGGGHEAQAT